MIRGQRKEGGGRAQSDGRMKGTEDGVSQWEGTEKMRGKEGEM